jgi:hypothetical protein
MSKLLVLIATIALLATTSFAAYVDRHADYVDAKVAATSATQCEAFYGTEDSRAVCRDWCQQWRQTHKDAVCLCNDGRCPVDVLSFRTVRIPPR